MGRQTLAVCLIGLAEINPHSGNFWFTSVEAAPNDVDRRGTTISG